MFNRRPTNRVRRISSVGGSGGFSPLSVPSIKLWLDPTSGLSGTTIKTWVDRVQGISFVQQASNSAAFQLGTSINGHVTIDAGGNTFLQSTSILSSIISANAYWVMVVFRYTGAHAEDGTQNQPSLIQDSATYFTKQCSTTTFNNKHFDAAQKNDQVSIATATNYYIFMKYDGTKIYTSINGAALDAGTTAGSVGNVTNVLQTGGSTFIGSYGAVMVGNAVPSATDVANLQRWARLKFNI